MTFTQLSAPLPSRYDITAPELTPRSELRLNVDNSSQAPQRSPWTLSDLPQPQCSLHFLLPSPHPPLHGLYDFCPGPLQQRLNEY